MNRRLVVVDASAVVAWIFKEPGHEEVDKILPHAVISAVNLIEVLYITERKGHKITGARLTNSLTEYGLRVEPVSQTVTERAAELIKEAKLRTGKPISLADAVCLALAERLQLPVTGGDRQWQKLPLETKYQPFR
jgi:PIN domain nuclease of toxin-antitoxin system